MKIFRPLYDKVIAWSQHRHANRYLGFVSFIESSFFPIPTAIMLAPMVMANRDKAWWLATLTTITSVLGGIFGYLIGLLLFEQIGQPIITFYGYEDKFLQFQDWFRDYGVGIVFLAGMTIIPYKVITITSGLVSMAFIQFVIASLFGRASQFFLVAALVKWGGEKMEPMLHEYMEWIGWGVLILAVAGFMLLKLV